MDYERELAQIKENLDKAKSLKYRAENSRGRTD